MMVKNVKGEVRAIDMGNGIYELRKEPDVLCVIPGKQKRTHKALTVVGTFGIFAGAAAAVIYLAPPIGTVLFALIAWCLFAGMATEDKE